MTLVLRATDTQPSPSISPRIYVRPTRREIILRAPCHICDGPGWLAEREDPPDVNSTYHSLPMISRLRSSKVQFALLLTAASRCLFGGRR